MPKRANFDLYTERKGRKGKPTGVKAILLYLDQEHIDHVKRLREKIAKEKKKPAELVNMQDVVRRALRTGK